jgi:hypothetical protein
MVVSNLSVSAQGWKSLKNKAKAQTEKVSIPKEIPSSGDLTQDEVGRGLKEALNQGVKKGVEQLNKKDGYLKDPQIKIPMPDEAKKCGREIKSVRSRRKSR